VPQGKVLSVGGDKMLVTTMFDMRQDVSPNHVFQGERMFFQKAFYQMFDKKIQEKTLFKSNILCSIEKFLKHNYLKWSFILDFKLKD
jgi:hypothetical protein